MGVPNKVTWLSWPRSNFNFLFLEGRGIVDRENKGNSTLSEAAFPVSSVFKKRRVNLEIWTVLYNPVSFSRNTSSTVNNPTSCFTGKDSRTEVADV